jgi:hypothetical protein
VWQEFSWERARGWLSGLPGGAGLNAGYEAVDRHATGARAGAVALRFRELGLPEGDTSTLGGSPMSAPVAVAHRTGRTWQ